MSNESSISLLSCRMAAALAGSSAWSPGGPDGDNRAEVLEEPLDLVAELGLDEVFGHLGDVVEFQVEVEAAAAVAGRFEPVPLPHLRPSARRGLQRDPAVLLVFSDGEGDVGLAAHDVVEVDHHFRCPSAGVMSGPTGRPASPTGAGAGPVQASGACTGSTGLAQEPGARKAAAWSATHSA